MALVSSIYFYLFTYFFRNIYYEQRHKEAMSYRWPCCRLSAADFTCEGRHRCSKRCRGSANDEALAGINLSMQMFVSSSSTHSPLVRSASILPQSPTRSRHPTLVSERFSVKVFLSFLLLVVVITFDCDCERRNYLIYKK